jgi:hypothetical protein
MKSLTMVLCGLAAAVSGTVRAAELDLESVPPVVVCTVPRAGARDVDPALNEIRVTFSKAMTDGSWSWCTVSEDSFPRLAGTPRYETGRRTCVLPVELEPGTTYGIWLNTAKFTRFRDTGDRPAVPYLLVFRTRD